ncbi:MAG: T9SS type A sorting domain-containing protein [Bacteroidetes bacterium]|nr:T9SS type A sorting domain-containing protein [Bacteroidota bacterium]
MKKFTLIISVSLLCGFVFNINAQNSIRIDASFYSQVLDEVRKVNVFLPGDYYVNPEQEYATIYYLHGGGGNQTTGSYEANWYYNLHAQDTTVSSPPAIFVCPDGSCEPYLGSCWMNSELYGSYEDYFIQDVIGFIESNFRAYPDKNFRLLTGMSMGGYGSARFSVKYPDMFRACVPSVGFLSVPDTLMNAWKDLYYNENGSYVPTVNNGTNTQLLLTMCGGLSPNLANPPCYVDFPFDTSGNMVDTVLNRWYQNDLSRKVKDLPDEHELSWFMIGGTEDYMVTHPTYQVFTDSLDHYGIDWDCSYFEGGHVFHPESWMMAIHWMDSIINMEYSTLGVGDHLVQSSMFEVRSYPNPVSEICTLEFELKSPEFVSITVFNSAGKKILQSKTKQYHSGEQQIQINMTGKNEGIYFCRIQAGNEIITKKIIKVK